MSRSRSTARKSNDTTDGLIHKDERNGKIILKILCALIRQKGDFKPLDIRDLAKSPQIKIKDQQQLVSFLKRLPTFFDLDSPENSCYVKPHCVLSICPTHITKPGSCNTRNCTDLHICKHFILGKCKFEDECTKGHSFTEQSNRKKIIQNNLQDLSDEDLLVIIGTNIPSQGQVQKKKVLTTCKFYNTGQQSCTNSSCSFLHLCVHYITGRCKFGSRCKRSHNLADPQVTNVLQEHGIDVFTKSEGDILTTIQDSLSENSPNVGSGVSRAQSMPFTNPDSSASRGRNYLSDLNLNAQIRPSTPPAFYPVSGARLNDLNVNTRPVTPPAFYPVSGARLNDLNVNTRPATPPAFYPVGGARLNDLNVNTRPATPPAFYPVGGARLNDLNVNTRPGIRPAFPPFGGARLNDLNVNTRRRPAFPPFSGARPKTSVQRGLAVNPLLTTTQLSDQNNPEICSFYVKDKCSYASKCKNYHPSSKLLYQWQKAAKGMQVLDWKDFSLLNTSIEKSYCNPWNTKFCFTEGNGPGEEVNVSYEEKNGLFDAERFYFRRLSTRSEHNDTKTGYCIPTIWKWYWIDDASVWHEYGEKVLQFSANIDSSKIEKEYQTSAQTSLEFATSGFKYTLDFEKMKQKNMSIGTEREVRRRPEFVTEADIKEKIASAMRDGVVYPKEWEKTTYENGFKKFQLSADSKEFQEVSSEVIANLLSEGITRSVESIHRIQNPDIFESYTRKLKKMKAPMATTEKRLFHGTTDSIVDQICFQGFDFRMSGSRTGAKFGKGSYFSTSAKYSLGYTNSDTLFRARVLTGEYTRGDPSYTRPPPKDKKKPNILYDSCVNSESNPTMYIVFDLHQAYPEYLIKFKP